MLLKRNNEAHFCTLILKVTKMFLEQFKFYLKTDSIFYICWLFSSRGKCRGCRNGSLAIV